MHVPQLPQQLSLVMINWWM